MKILLLSPPIKHPGRVPPIGLMYLQSCLEKAGYSDTRLVDMRNFSFEEAEKLIAKEKPDIAGISCLTPYRANSLKLAELCKKVDKKIVTVLGGCHATFLFEQILQNFPFVDIVALGEGEQTIVEIADSVRKHSPFGKIKGIAFLRNGKITKTEPRPLIKDLDSLPFPSYKDLDLDFYRGDKPFEKGERRANIISSRGCPFGCQFCSTTRFWGLKWRSRSAKNVVDEIEWLNKQYKYKHFFFADDVFTVSRQRIIDICREIANRGLKIKWFAETRVDVTSKEMFEWMKKAGCQMVEFGVESGSPTILKGINKMISIEQIKNAFSQAKSAGLKTQILLIVGNPGESRETINETKALLSEIKPDLFIISILMVFPSTPLYDLAKSKGFIDDSYWLADKLAPNYTVELDEQTMISWRAELFLHSYLSKGLLKGLPELLAFSFSEFKGWGFEKSFKNVSGFLRGIVAHK